MQLTQLKNYLKIDHDFDDEILKLLLEVAESYVNDAIDFDELETQKLNPKYEYCIVLLVAHYYENRSATSEVNLNDIPFGVMALLQQLRYAK